MLIKTLALIILESLLATAAQPGKEGLVNAETLFATTSDPSPASPPYYDLTPNR